MIAKVDIDIQALAAAVAPLLKPCCCQHGQAPASRRLTSSEVSKLCRWPSAKAMFQAFRRHRDPKKNGGVLGPLHPLEQLMLEEDGVRRWRADDVEHYLAQGQGR